MELFSPETLGLIFLALLTLTAYTHSPDTSESYNATLVDVTDGDTIDVTVNGREDTVRFLGVDTPETHAENSPEEFNLSDNPDNRACLREYGEEAANFVERRLGGDLRIETDSLSDRRGSYGRMLAYVYDSNNSVNRQLLEEGLARVYTGEFSREKEYLKIEKEAREEGKGLWSCANTTIGVS
jgi:micrococcal nuclease